MDIFSQFCNICWTFDNKSLKNICEVNDVHLKNTLITLIEHADIVNNNTIYLCHLCCDELIRFNNFRGMCLSNLIQLRRLYLNELSKTESEEKRFTVKNMLEEFIHEEVFKNNSFGKKNIKDLQEIARRFSDMFKTGEFVNRQLINVYSERGDREFFNECTNSEFEFKNEKSHISQISGNSSEELKAEIFESKSGENANFLMDFENELEKEELHIENETQNSAPQGFEMQQIKKQYCDDVNLNFASDVDVKFYFDVSAKNNTNEINNSHCVKEENKIVASLEVQKIKNESFDDYQHIELNLDMTAVNNSSNENDNSQIVFAGKKLCVKEETASSENFVIQKIENDSIDFVPGINNSNKSIHTQIKVVDTKLSTKQENNTSETLKVEEYKSRPSADLNVAFQIANVHTFINMEDTGERDMRSEDVEERMQLQDRTCNSVFTAGITTRQQSRRHRHKRLPATQLYVPHEHGAKPLICMVCKKTFTLFSELSEHKHIHSGNRLYKCTICNKAFAKSSSLTSHKRTHSTDKPYKCTVCNKKVKTLRSLIVHGRIHSGDRPYKCPVCNKTFAVSSNFTRHKRTHTDEIPFKCNFCNKAFRDSSGLTKHKRRHTGEKPYKCNVCNKAFTNSSDLTKHASIHNGMKPYKCNVCNKAFTQSFALTRHKRIHTGIKPYKCNVCNKAFTSSGALTSHASIHTGIKPYKCNVCNKAFTRSGALTTHESIHTGIKPYKCNVCNKAFTRSDHLTKHASIHTGIKPYKCNVCNKAFTESVALTRHASIHTGIKPYKCNVCNKAFTRSGALTRHASIHTGISPYKCLVCNKVFTRSGGLTRHASIHTGIKPYKCPVCNKAFTESYILAKHKCT